MFIASQTLRTMDLLNFVRPLSLMYVDYNTGGGPDYKIKVTKKIKQQEWPHQHQDT